MSRAILPLGARAGTIDARGRRLDRPAWPGTPVAVANVDAHASAPAVRVTGPGTFVMIMGTSTCDILLGDEPAFVEGMCGLVEGGVVPGLYGFEAGQSAVGDIFAWFAESSAPPEAHEEAQRRGVTVHEVLEQAAAPLRPAESGLLALDWWNGNRSVLVDADLRGLLVGMTLATTPAEIYRALMEATAFGTRVIVEAFESAGVPVDSIVACGGLPERNKLLMQIYADVLGREIAVGASKQAPALGAAMHGAVAAGSARVDRGCVSNGWHVRAPSASARRRPRTPSTTGSTPSTSAARPLREGRRRCHADAEAPAGRVRRELERSRPARPSGGARGRSWPASRARGAVDRLTINLGLKMTGFVPSPSSVWASVPIASWTAAATIFATGI